MISVVTCILCFVSGAFLGTTFKTLAFESQPWRVMKWNKDSLGYRPVMIGSRVFPNDKIVMSLEVDTSQFEEEGALVE